MSADTAQMTAPKLDPVTLEVVSRKLAAITDEMYSAEKGGGAFLNNKRIRVAQRRDIHDDKLVVEFARTVGSPEALKRLYLLTYADMRATGPKVSSCVIFISGVTSASTVGSKNCPPLA